MKKKLFCFLITALLSLNVLSAQAAGPVSNFDETGIIICLAFIILLIAILFIMAKKMCEIAELKGYNAKEKHIFAICFWLGFLGYLYTIGLPDIKVQELLKEKFDSNI
ncbi:MAG: hypothetical protein IK024_09480 [Treponema sp.]|nr:hypothetical protein [Treponema sp.]